MREKNLFCLQNCFGSTLHFYIYSTVYNFLLQNCITIFYLVPVQKENKHPISEEILVIFWIISLSWNWKKSQIFSGCHSNTMNAHRSTVEFMGSCHCQSFDVHKFKHILFEYWWFCHPANDVCKVLFLPMLVQ